MAKRRYLLTSVSCNCETDSIFFDLDDDEKALLERISEKFEDSRAAIEIEDPDAADEFSLQRAESAERRRAIEGS